MNKKELLQMKKIQDYLYTEFHKHKHETVETLDKHRLRMNGLHDEIENLKPKKRFNFKLSGKDYFFLSSHLLILIIIILSRL